MAWNPPEWLKPLLCSAFGLYCKPPVPPPPPEPEVYEVRPGHRVEKTMKPMSRLEFDITGINAQGMNGEKAHAMWAYNPAFDGGNPVGKGFCVGVRDYKIKVYDKDGKFIREPRYGIPFVPSKKYRFGLWVFSDSVKFTIFEYVGDKPELRIDINVPVEPSADFQIGYGWPPNQRPGFLGCKITNIVCEELKQ